MLSRSTRTAFLFLLVSAAFAACGGGGSAAQRRGVGAGCAVDTDCTQTGLTCLSFKGGYCGLANCVNDAGLPCGVRLRRPHRRQELLLPHLYRQDPVQSVSLRGLSIELLVERDLRRPDAYREGLRSSFVSGLRARPDASSQSSGLPLRLPAGSLFGRR